MASVHWHLQVYECQVGLVGKPMDAALKLVDLPASMQDLCSQVTQKVMQGDSCSQNCTVFGGSDHFTCLGMLACLKCSFIYGTRLLFSKLVYRGAVVSAVVKVSDCPDNIPDVCC